MKRKTLFPADAISTKIASTLDTDFKNAHELSHVGVEVDFFQDSQKENLLKKYVSNVYNKKSLDSQAFADFSERLKSVDTNNNLFSKMLNDGINPLYLRRAKNIIDSILGDAPGMLDLFEQAKTSPGSTIGTTYIDCNLIHKFTYPLTGNEASIRWFRRYLEWDHQLDEAINDLNKYSNSQKYQVTNESVAVSVEKDMQKRRLIFKEPTLNMFFQKSIEYYLIDRMKPFLDIERLQDTHKVLASEFSITGRNATVDLKDASDRISLELIKYLLPPSWFYLLSMFRSTHTKILNDESTKLPMFSTMGNAFTFPLETIVFFSLSVAVCENLYGNIRSAIVPDWDDIKTERISVYGDDIILPCEYYTNLKYIFDIVGLVINEKKSFYSSEEKFRESCGSDFYDGRNVRSFYMKAPPNLRDSTRVPWICVIFNRLSHTLRRVYGKNYIYIFWSTLCCILSHIRTTDIISVVPDFYPEDSGLKTYDDVRLLELFRVMNISLRNFSNFHDSSLFYYYSWNYPESEECEFLRYWFFLKFGSLEIPMIFQRKKFGGYTVRRGIFHKPLLF